MNHIPALSLPQKPSRRESDGGGRGIGPGGRGHLMTSSARASTAGGIVSDQVDLESAFHLVDLQGRRLRNRHTLPTIHEEELQVTPHYVLLV